ncbi:MAG: hypothetical protein K2N48_01060 [Muribaculaceae bacterium]|nr:hypothetical protein [Muribaculaceae bacterium]
MDADKVNEAAITYAKENTTALNPFGRIMDDFKAGADWLMQQPLSDRMTDKEKKKIIKRYNDELEVAQHHTLKMKESTNPTSRQFHANVREGYISRLKLLETIFGKDLFNEK